MDPHAVEIDTPVSILLVDDRPQNHLALKAILASPDYRLVEASSGAEALRRLLDEEFAVLLVDVMMPEMSGFELATAVRQRARTAMVPILFLTGQAADVDFVYKGYQIGAVDYLVKPLVPEMVRAKVAVFAELYRQRKRIEQQAARLVEAERKENELRMIELRLAGERRYRSLAEAVPNIIWTAGADGQIDYFNQRWYEYTGVSAERAAGSWRQSIHPDDLGACEERWRQTLHSGGTFLAECRLRAADGAFRWHLARAVPERGSGGQVASWFGTFTDIDDQKRTEAVLAEFKGTLDAVLDAVMIIAPDTWRFLYVNHGATALLGYSEQELLHMRPFEFMLDQDEQRFRDLIAPLQQDTKSAINVETRCRRKDGREIPAEFSFQIVHVNGDHIVSIARDITERKELESKLEHEAHTDALTGCANRRWFLELAGHEVARARRHGEEVALLMLDLDRFKSVNDRYGHPVGDLALKKVAEVCRKELRKEDAVGRLGGEEFAILLPETDTQGAMEIGERVRQAVATSEIPLEDEPPLRVTTSIGATVLRPEDDVAALLGRADKALYAAKEAGRNRVCRG